MEKDWKLKLRYGKITTPYSHFTLIGEGAVTELIEGFDCPAGNAFMTMKIWATDLREAQNIFNYVSSQIGFDLTGETNIYDTEPVEPPREEPFGYDISFSPFE